MIQRDFSSKNFSIAPSGKKYGAVTTTAAAQLIVTRNRLALQLVLTVYSTF